ncbi:hypothetical protein [Sphingobium vermicomposti]|uniref:Lipoprotein n=1 Tax=Sphingobium vermicomposti TaxID=529005 RepID=A0A846MEW7_9SPHN|nr:hypothetical protein [Sphingobium vermicomposti]NIJ15106.1 hypothetical protein [Sphingobium vermicomposti]
MAVAITLSGCTEPTWPKKYFPTEMEVKRTLFASSEFGLREGCDAFVAEISDRAATRLVRVEKKDSRVSAVPPNGWRSSPMEDESNTHRYYESAFGGCNSADGPPLGDLPGALKRPGAFYRIINNGEAIAIIVPNAKLAGFFNFG